MLAPATGEVIASIAAGDAEDVDLAVKSARRSLEQGAWGRMTATERGRLLSRLGRLIEDNAEELVKLEAADTGKPMKQAKADVTAVARYFEYYGAAADKVHGDTIPFLDGYLVTTLYEPLGVTGHIIPWNYPGQMLAERWRRLLRWAMRQWSSRPRRPAWCRCGSQSLRSKRDFRNRRSRTPRPSGPSAGATGAGRVIC